MNYLEILQPAIQEKVNEIRVTYTLVEGKKETMLWYKFPKQYAPYLTIEVADAVVSDRHFFVCNGESFICRNFKKQS